MTHLRKIMFEELERTQLFGRYVAALSAFRRSVRATPRHVATSPSRIICAAIRPMCFRNNNSARER